MPTEQILTVTSADFQRNLGLYQHEALNKPVAITQNGRPRTVLRVLPVTHKAPQRMEDAIEIPPATTQHLGLDSERSGCVITEGE
ncbi:MAG: hypothetical protein M0038_00025 [Pseudomonadota bacterium]|jgi:hypothetical protein|nr:hypothetical protein [Pseudomonadota bacterium]